LQLQGLVGKGGLASEDAGEVGLDGGGMVGTIDGGLPGVEFVEVDGVYSNVGVYLLIGRTRIISEHFCWMLRRSCVHL
jgi:hypothetical protein